MNRSVRQERFGGRWPLQVGVMASGWIAAMTGNHLIASNSFSMPLTIALVDECVHGLIAILVIWPFFSGRSTLPARFFVIAALLAVLIDLDHAVAAGSFDVRAMMSLPARPLAHSYLFALGTAFVAGGVTAEPELRRNVFYIYFASLASHILRDSLNSYHTPWAFPFQSFPVNHEYGFALLIALSFVHLTLAFAGGWKTSRQSSPSG